jgi:glycosyltransferase involved in cell wall biosynthesis
MKEATTQSAYARIAPIAIVSHSHPSLSKGGAEIAAYTLFGGLSALGCDVTFITACDEKHRAKLSLGSSRERAVFHDSSAFDHFHQCAKPELVDALRRALPAKIRTVNFHHFIHFGIGAVRSIAENPEIVTVLTLHELLSICHHHGQMITKPAHNLCREATPTACVSCFPEYTRQEFSMRRRAFLDSYQPLDGFISPSHFLAERHVAWGLDRSRVAVVENGLLHRETPVNSRRGGPFVFGFFGQINPFKGVDTILRAAEAISRMNGFSDQVRIRIHGNVIGQPAKFIDRLMKLVETLPCLSYSGPYDHTDVFRLMSACDYVVVPSVWWENSPMVIQEAYSAGRPVICTGIGGMAEKVIDGVTGLHFRVNEHLDLVAAIQHAADDKVLARLQAGIPKVMDSKAMAVKYLRAFLHFSGAKLKSRTL